MTDAMTWVDVVYWIVIAGAAWRIDYLTGRLEELERKSCDRLTMEPME